MKIVFTLPYAHTDPRNDEVRNDIQGRTGAVIGRYMTPEQEPPGAKHMEVLTVLSRDPPTSHTITGVFTRGKSYMPGSGRQRFERVFREMMQAVTDYHCRTMGTPFTIVILDGDAGGQEMARSSRAA